MSRKVEMNLAKTPTGIQGLDEVTAADFPKAAPPFSVAAQAAAKRCLEFSFL